MGKLEWLYYVEGVVVKWCMSFEGRREERREGKAQLLTCFRFWCARRWRWYLLLVGLDAAGEEEICWFAMLFGHN